MEIERRERDPDTGEIIGAGFGDVFGKIVAKLTGKTAKKLATKAAEKLVEKGAEKVGEKTGQLVGAKRSEHTSRNKRKRNWEDACGEAAPSCSSRKKQISKNK